MPRRADEDHLVREERLELDSAAAAGGADDAELELALGHEGDDRLRVVHRQANVQRRVRLMELAEEQRHDDRRRARRCADLERARERARTRARRGRRAAAPRARAAAVRSGRAACLRRSGTTRRPERSSSWMPTPLLERAHLLADGRLRDAERRRGAREALALDDGAERRSCFVSIRPCLYQARYQCQALGHGRFVESPGRARLDRHHELAARAVLPPAHPSARGGRPRGRGDGTRVRPDRAAARAPRHRRDDHREPTAADRGSASRARWPRGFGSCATGPRPRRFDAALSHGSYDLTLTARRLRIPSTTTFDYEFALAQHQFGARAATRVVVPEAIPAERLRRYGLRPPKLARYPGLKEEYYLADFEPDPAVPPQLGVDPVADPRRPPPAARRRALSPQRQPPLPAGRSSGSAGVRTSTRSCSPARRSSVPICASLALPSVIVPERAVDAQSLIAAADLVISAGGTMNREAVALGVPVYTVFAGTARGRRRAADPRRQACSVLTRARGIEVRRRSEDGHGLARLRDPRKDAWDSSSDAPGTRNRVRTHRDQGGT